MAVPETLCHPFATAKIVVMPVTWSVIAGPIIVARSRDACLLTHLRQGLRYNVLDERSAQFLNWSPTLASPL
jgi:hypothetical protein